MGFLSVVGNMAKSCVDVKSWIGYDTMKGATRTLFRSFRALTIGKKASFTESFDEAITRLDISENDLQALTKRFLFETYFYLVVTACITGYMLYLFWQAALISGFLTILVILLGLLKTFESHFYYFQIKHRKLGCTFKEWFQGRIEETL